MAVLSLKKKKKFKHANRQDKRGRDLKQRVIGATSIDDTPSTLVITERNPRLGNFNIIKDGWLSLKLWESYTYQTYFFNKFSLWFCSIFLIQSQIPSHPSPTRAKHLFFHIECQPCFLRLKENLFSLIWCILDSIKVILGWEIVSFMFQGVFLC